MVGFKFLETLVAGNHEQLVRAGKGADKLIGGLQPILGIVFQLLTFLINIETVAFACVYGDIVPFDIVSISYIVSIAHYSG